jgi:hypothetical protein
MSCCWRPYASSGFTAVTCIIAVVGVTAIGGVRIQNSHACVPLRIFIINVHNIF